MTLRHRKRPFDLIADTSGTNDFVKTRKFYRTCLSVDFMTRTDAAAPPSAVRATKSPALGWGHLERIETLQETELNLADIKGDGTMADAKAVAMAVAPSGRIVAVMCQKPGLPNGYTTHLVDRRTGSIGNGHYSLTFPKAMRSLAERTQA